MSYNSLNLNSYKFKKTLPPDPAGICTKDFLHPSWTRLPLSYYSKGGQGKITSVYKIIVSPRAISLTEIFFSDRPFEQ